MPGRPDATELLGAVRDFIAGLPLEGRDAFHAKVAANVLAIVVRELAAGPDGAGAAVLADFLLSQPLPSSPRTRGPISGGLQETSPRVRGDDGGKVEAVASRTALHTSLCARLRDGTVTLATPGLLDALITATCARLAVDNPRYSTLARLRGEISVSR